MKKNIAILLTILMAANTLTACTQANGTTESSVASTTKTVVSTMDEAEKPTQGMTAAIESVTAETSPVSDKSEPSTTEPSKPKKSETSQNSGSVGQNNSNDGEQSGSPQTSNNEAPAQQPKAESTPKATDTPKSENKPKATEKPKSESKPKQTEKPKSEEKPKQTEKPAEQPKKKSIDFGRVTNALIGYGTSLGMVYNSSLNTGNAGWFPPLDVSDYSDTDSVISAGYDEVGYLPYYFGSSAEPGDIAFNVIVSNNQIYIVYG